jgi:pimeloyl-ACP methyl ester carboxylesterase
MTTTDVPHRPGLQSARVNGIRIAHADSGGGRPPLVLVHGSWGSHRNWDAVVPGLTEHFRVVTYDRRGHSDSDRPAGPGHFSEDVADLAALIEQLDLAPAWVAGNSAGAVITLKLAASRPHLLRGIIVHEPPLFGLLPAAGPEAGMWASLQAGPLAEVRRRIAAGDHAGAAEQFVDQVALGPGSWARMPDDLRQTMASNAPSYLDELDDPESTIIDEARLGAYPGPVMISSGDQSPPIFRPVLDRLGRLLPQASRTTFTDAGHIPHVTHPYDYVARVTAFARAADRSRR